MCYVILFDVEENQTLVSSVLLMCVIRYTTINQYGHMRTILVTGAAGFIGSHLVRTLIASHHKVSIVVRPASDLSRIKDVLPNVRRFVGDLADRKAMEIIVKEANPIGVFHCAVSNMQRGVAAPDEEVIRNNMLGIVNLLTALGQTDYRFFVNTGSFLEYSVGSRTQKESDRCEPMELYSITKLAATLYGQMVAWRDKKPIVTLRLFSPYGTAMQKGRLLETVISHALSNEDIPMTEPHITRDLIFVEDIVDLYLEAMERAREMRGEVFNMGTGTSTTLQELVRLVIRLTGSTGKAKWNALPRVSYDSDTWQADMEKTFSRFAWRPKHTLQSGIQETIAWIRANKPTA